MKKQTGLTFKEAFELALIGECIKLPEWGGFWFINFSTSKLMVFTKDGEILDSPDDAFKDRNDWENFEPSDEQKEIIKKYLNPKVELKELTLGQKRVMRSFNPSANQQVEDLKEAYATLIDVLEANRNERNGREISIAQTEAETSCMYAVKSLFV